MKPWAAHLLILLAALLAGAAGLLAGRWWHGSTASDGVQIGAPMPEFRMTTLDGDQLGPADFRGRVLLVNFWATWCAPCLREIPLFQRLRQEYGRERLEILGVAMDEEEAVRDFAARLAIEYPLLLASIADLGLSRALGNPRDALPFSVLVDAGGRLRARKLGEYHEAELRAAIEDAMR